MVIIFKKYTDTSISYNLQQLVASTIIAEDLMVYINITFKFEEISYRIWSMSMFS